jgi:hypothetical protein
MASRKIRCGDTLQVTPLKARVWLREIERSDQDRAIRLTLAHDVFSARKRFNFDSMFLECGLGPQPASGRKMIIKRLEGYPAPHARLAAGPAFAILCPETGAVIGRFSPRLPCLWTKPSGRGKKIARARIRGL